VSGSVPTRDLAPIVAFLPELESAGFSPGCWRGGAPGPSGAIQAPWFEYSPRMEALLAEIRRAGLVLMGFDWMAWLDSPEGRGFRDDPGRIEQAAEIELARLLTAIIRGDRFIEGNIAGAFESGHLLRIIRRMKTLLPL